MAIYGLRLDCYNDSGMQGSQFIGFFDQSPSESLKIEMVSKTLGKSVDVALSELSELGYIKHLESRVVYVVRDFNVEDIVWV